MEENYNIAKWLNNELEGDELQAFESSEDFAIYQKIKIYSAQLKTPDFDENALLTKVLDSKKSKVMPLHRTWLFRIAAVLILSFGLSFAFLNFMTTTEIAKNGMKTEFSLPDNSEIVLNAGSTIKYKKWNWNSNRSLNLEGEAYFKVAKGKTFEVKTDLGTVTVLGTQFNVKNRNQRLDVTCFEGKVSVNYQNEQILLTKGMQVSFDSGEKIDMSNLNNQKPDWLNNKIYFNKERLQAILDEVSRQYDVEFENNSKNANQLFTGVLPLNNLDIALEIISTTYHLKVTKTSTSKFVLQNTND